MDNLRWILIFLGVAILVLLYLSGRQSTPKRRDTNTQLGRKMQGEDDPLLDDDMNSDVLDGFDGTSSAIELDGQLDGQFDAEFDGEFDDTLVRPAGADNHVKRPVSLGGGISQKIEAIGKRLSPKGKGGDAAADKKAKAPQTSKIVTLHVVAPEGDLMNGAHLLEQFEQRGYHYGDMNIFHSMHEGQTVFSVAKLVMPGTFDINDMDSFQTPGVSLILQLPGPVPADVAFEVLLSEAHELADAMDGTVLDADRSTLSKQTVQHMREGINEYLHKQKYSSAVS